MAKTIKLASVLLKCSLGTGKTDGSQKTSVKYILNILMVVCLLPLLYFLFQGGILVQELFGSLDGNGMILRFLLLMISIFIFVMGIPACINTFYLSSNLNGLLVMPFSSIQITSAKFMVAAFYEYYISFAILAPILAGYGYAGNYPTLYWVGAVLTVLILPIIPLTYSAIISMLVMRVLGGAKNKQRTTMMGAIGSFLLLLIYEIISNATRGMKIETLEQTIAHLAKTLNTASAVFPNIPFVTNLMIKQDLLSLVWTILAVVVVFLVFLFLASRLYLAGAVGMQSASANHKALDEKTFEKANRPRSVEKSYLRKELKTILRTPAYYMQCLFLTLGWPLVILLPMLFSDAQKNEIATLEKLGTSLGNQGSSAYVVFGVVFGVTVFVAALNFIAPSSISREGQNFAFMKQIPVPYKVQLRAKRNAALCVCGIGSTVYLFLGELFLVLTKGFAWWIIPFTLITSFLVLVIVLDFEMIHGLAKPMLVWESEGEVMTKNVMGFLLFLLDLILCGGMVYLYFALPASIAEGSLLVIAGGVVAILAVLAFVVERIFYAYGIKRMETL